MAVRLSGRTSKRTLAETKVGHDNPAAFTEAASDIQAPKICSPYQVFHV